tara:strand:- start:277 stop:924 length:648 start_codon:yes stop_codon:yes gene_type:complete
MRSILKSEISNFEKRYRARLINSLSGVKSANLIGTISESGQENVAIVSSCFHIGADPALMGMIFRPAVVERHTYENILSTGYYTINHVNSEIVEKAHQTSARYPKEVSEFSSTGLGPIYIDGFKAPFVEQSSVRIGLKLKENVHLQINGTELIIGEIEIINLEESFIRKDGFIDLHSAGSAGVTGLDCYHDISLGQRYSYAKVDKKTRQLDIEGD